MIDLRRVLKARPKEAPAGKLADLYTVWGEEVLRGAADPETGPSLVPRSEHPNPQFQRDSFLNLNGWWACAFEPLQYDPLEDASFQLEELCAPASVDTPILVPFSPESNLSAVRRALGVNEVLWYRRAFQVPTVETGKRYLLHFQAVDDTCAVWLNGRLLGSHSGGYQPFSFDATDALRAGENRLELAVVDPSDAGIQLRGKQRSKPGGIWYTAQSGIWQSVWMEAVPDAHLMQVQVCIELSQDMRRAQVGVEAVVRGSGSLRLEILNSAFGECGSSSGVLACGAGEATGEPDGTGRVRMSFAVEGPHLWSPDDPFLHAVRYRFGEDEVQGYLAFRVSEVKECDGAMRFHLNGKPYFLKGVLDQGYWPESHMTAPADDALAFDIGQMRDLGFNMLRKHIKIEDSRWYYHCDRLGMLVWQDMVTGGGAYGDMATSYLPTLFSCSWGSRNDAKAGFQCAVGAESRRYQLLWRNQTQQAVSALGGHPSIVTWVLFNEGWGQFDSAAMTREVRALDPSRPIESVSGWYDQGAGDYYGVHNYFRGVQLFRDRKGCRASLDPEGAMRHVKRACVTCEFGGIVYAVAGHTQRDRCYGYDIRETQAEYAQAVRGLLDEMDALEREGLAGYVYTQLSDVEEEANGLLTYDRRVNKLSASGMDGGQS